MNRRTIGGLAGIAAILFFGAARSDAASGEPGDGPVRGETAQDAARAAAIACVPTLPEAIVFGVDQLRPGWTNMSGLIVHKDYFGAGVAGVQFVGNNDLVSGHAAYWPLNALEPGRYWVGLWIESGSAQLLTESVSDALRTPAYLNGWPLRFATASDPLQVAPGRWIVELQTAGAIPLQASDEIAVSPMWGQGQFLRLALHRKEPVRGHLVAGQVFGAKAGGVRLRVVAEPELRGSGEDGAEHEAVIRVANPLPYAVDIDIVWQLADYFGKPLEGGTTPMRLDKHASQVFTRRFVAQGDAQAYQLDVRTKPSRGFKPPVSRPAELLELNDFTRIEFLPNLPSPLQSWKHVRLELKNDGTGDRRWQSLNDGWQRGPLAGRRMPDTVPGGIAYSPCRVPETAFHVALPKDVYGYWYRRTFRVPEGMRGRNLMLEVGYAKCEGTIFVNGQKVGHARGGYAPIRADITRALRPDADNELVIGVRGGIGLVREDYVDRYDPENWQDREGNRDVYGVATMSGAFLGPVTLHMLPAVRTRQVLVVPDVEKGTVLVLARVENQSDRVRTVEVRYHVEQKGMTVARARVPPQTVTLQPGEMREIRALGSGRQLAEYTPAAPVLSRMVVTLTQDGQALDEFSQRFGYRTVKVHGTGLALNSRPMNFLGSGPFYMLNDWFEHESGTDISRCFGPSYTQDGPEACDEVGRFYYISIGEGSGQPWDKLRNDNFWKSACDALVETTWENGSQPGAVVWDIWNESYHYQVYSTGIEGRDLLAKRIKQVIDALRERVWPDFWFISDGNEELGGLLDFNSVHYLNHGGGLTAGTWRNPEHGGYAALGRDRVTGYWPDSFYLSGAAVLPKPGTIVTGPTPDWKYGSTAWGDTETFWYTGGLNGVGNCKYIGDRVALGTTARMTPRGWSWEKTAVDAYRDVEMALIGGLYWHGFQNVAVQDVTFSLPEQAVRYFGGARFDRRLNIHDDEYAPGKLTFTWTLTDPEGKILRRGSTSMRSTSAFLKRDRLTFDLPCVSQRTACTLSMELRKNGVLRAYEERVVEAWPELTESVKGATVPTEPVALFDPAGQTRPVLESFGCRVRPVTMIDERSLAGSRFLVLGQDCVTGATAAQRQALQDFAVRGGRVLVLPQQEAGLVPADTYLENRLHASLGFVRAATHPVMQGLKDVDFQVWNSDHLIARGVYGKPATGNVLALVDCGHEITMAWSPLFEVFLGKGSIVACQLPILEKMATEPMCAELWKRLLGYMTQPAFRQPHGRLAVMDGASAPVLARLKQVRVEHTLVPIVPGPDAGVLLLEMNRATFEPLTAGLKQYLADGGTLILHRLRPEHAAWAADLLGRPVSIAVQPYRSWIDRQILERRNGLVEGLNNLDFYWRPVVEGESSESREQVSGGIKNGRGQVEYTVKVANAADYLFPGGLVEVPVGKGRVVIDQVAWETSEERIGCGSPRRILSVMLTNLGVSQRPPMPKPVLPANVRYEPVDITPVANRGLVDKVSGDGIGWLEWGPGADLSAFPTGDVTLGGIPFAVPKGDKNAIMLRVDPSKVAGLANYPDTVTIPVGKRNVAGLLFLHTGGWAFGEPAFGWREIVYADGTREKILLNGTNMADWNYGRDQFPDEEGTVTTVAWRGSNAVYAVTRVYKTLWVNPHPAKEIKEVVLTNRDLPPALWRVMPHLALTAAILTAEPASARDPARSEVLRLEAEVLIAQHKGPEAVAKIGAALHADSRNVSAWRALADLQIAAGNEGELRQVCQRWMTAMPDNYVVYNVLAEFLNKKGQKAEALKLYRQSLEIEWNQPPTLQAIQRLEKETAP
jgi:hypothetical protein